MARPPVARSSPAMLATSRGFVEYSRFSACALRRRFGCDTPERLSGNRSGFRPRCGVLRGVLLAGIAAARASRRPASPYGPWCDEPLLFPAPSGDEVAHRAAPGLVRRPRARSWRWPASMRGGRRVGSGAQP